MTTGSGPRHVVDAADIGNGDLRYLLSRAEELSLGGPPDVRAAPVVGTLFLTSSMRTRVGFAVATMRLGGSALPVTELRFDEKMSGAESFEDALRVLTGMVDALVVRSPRRLDQEFLRTYAKCPVVNGGDAREHPTQALSDIAAIERFAGPIEKQRIAICGDARMRSVTSLLHFLARTPPRSLVIASPAGREPVNAAALRDWCTFAEPKDLGRFDVLLMPGLAPGTGTDLIDWADRMLYVASAQMLEGLSDTGIVISPMPVIDEIDEDVRDDPRLKMYEQSDHAVYVRMAVLEWVLAG